MRDRKEIKTIRAENLVSIVPPGKLKISKVYGSVTLKELADGNIVILTETDKLHIYNSVDLKNSKAKHEFRTNLDAIVISPNGEMILNKDDARLLVDPVTLEIKKQLDTKIKFDRGINCSCLINENQYIVISRMQNISGLNVFDAKSHECKAKINLFEKIEYPTWRQQTASMKSAAHLHNGKTVITLDSVDVVMFRYAEDKLSDVTWLDLSDFGLSYGHAGTIDVFPVSEDRFVTFIPDETDHSWSKTLLQFWDSNTGERLGEVVKISHSLPNPQLLPDGSIISFIDLYNLGEFCIIDGKTLKLNFYKVDSSIKAMSILNNDLVLLVTTQADLLSSSREFDLDVRIVELETLRKFKQFYITEKILNSSTLDKDTAFHIVAEYVGGDVVFPKNHKIGLFSLPTPQAEYEKMVELLKPFSVDINPMIRFFTEKKSDEDDECLVLMAKLRKLLKKPRVDTDRVEKIVRKLSCILEDFEEMPDYSRFAKRVKRLYGDIEKVRAEKNVQPQESVAESRP